MYTSAHDTDELVGIDIFPFDYSLQQASPEAKKLAGRTVANHAYYEESDHLQLKIQSFKSGGYEGTVRWVNAQRNADLQNIPRRIGKREEPEERSQESMDRSRIRARQKVRHHAKNIAANRLLTLTKRESEETGFSTPDDWQQYWARFCRVYKKYFPDLPFMFVAVLEQHKGSKHLHLHIATYSKQKMPLEIMRGIWWSVCGGRSMGNIDIKYIRKQGHHGTACIAKYLSKYISKGFDAIERFNKKRFGSVMQTFPRLNGCGFALKLFLVQSMKCASALVVQLTLGVTEEGSSSSRISQASSSQCIPAKAIHPPSSPSI